MKSRRKKRCGLGVDRHGFQRWGRWQAQKPDAATAITEATPKRNLEIADMLSLPSAEIDANDEHKSYRERTEVRDITAKMLTDAQIGKPQCHEQTDAHGRQEQPNANSGDRAF
jgi:hypothetical protein